jgi:uncharacterized repeat protein (TIGR02543 family)
MVNGKVKRFLSAALAVVMIGIFPVAALAADLVLTSGASVGGTGWNWDGSTLDLGGINFSDGIRLPAGAVIRLQPGSVNTVSNGVSGAGGLTIDGGGSGALNASTGWPEGFPFILPLPAIHSGGPLDIIGCNISASALYSGIETDNGGIRIINSTVDSVGIVSGAISASNTVQIVNSTVSALSFSAPIHGDRITLSDCEIVTPRGGHVINGSSGAEIVGQYDDSPIQVVIRPVIEKQPPAERYTVSYHPNGALCELPVDMNLYYRGDQVVLNTGEGLTRPGYEFAGWELEDGSPVADPFIMGNSDVTLFAVWRAK